ncbi:fatty acid desaturase [Leptospira selangorensis]|uniref:fatty acid desaturase family protein n=1 Tax=Leptospira selangorensis TaxID=2484982 RepID=UPI0010841A68|nr:fatty acid desaturase [Leptospira selangorensis]TGK03265.1 fatty acid desaturase [Leptospira selangorensis]
MNYEEVIESRFRKFPWWIPIFSGVLAFCLYVFLLYFHEIFISGGIWILPVSGLFLHSWMILLVHEGTHRNLTRSKFDRWILNLASAFVFLPFYGEPFRLSHLKHHAKTNLPDDPLWPRWKLELFRKNRILYVLLEFLPLVSSIFSLFWKSSSVVVGKDNKTTFSKETFFFLLLSFIVSGVLFYWFRPDLWFIFGTFFFANFWGCFRHWCEHTGYSKERESNTFYFPLGFGIGNHEIHHENPNLSWLSLALGLRKREKNISIFECFIGLCFSKKYMHYATTKENDASLLSSSEFS